MTISARAVARSSVLRRGAALVVLLGVALAWWSLLRPSSLGGPLTLVTVTGTSMEPGFHSGDLAVMRDQRSYEHGDVVAFRAEAVPGTPGAYVIHRIVGGNAASGYVTRGDNNDWDDPWRPTADDITGRLWFSVPALGSGVRWLAQPVHLAAVLAGGAASLTMVGGRRPPEASTAAPQRPDQVAA